MSLSLTSGLDAWKTDTARAGPAGAPASPSISVFSPCGCPRMRVSGLPRKSQWKLCCLCDLPQGSTASLPPHSVLQKRVTTAGPYAKKGNTGIGWRRVREVAGIISTPHGGGNPSPAGSELCRQLNLECSSAFSVQVFTKSRSTEYTNSFI